MNHDEQLSSRSGREPSGSTSPSLIASLRSRQPEAWERLVNLYGPLIYHWARKADLCAEDAADIVQDVLCSVWAGVAGFRRDSPGGTFRGWLLTITRNKISDHYRGLASRPSAPGGTEALRRMQQIGSPAPPSTSLHPANPGGYADLIQRALEAIRRDFSGNVWQAFLLTALQNRTSSEASAELGMRPNAVRQAKFRVLRRLREELGDL